MFFSFLGRRYLNAEQTNKNVIFAELFHSAVNENENENKKASARNILLTRRYSMQIVGEAYIFFYQTFQFNVTSSY